DQQGVAEPDFVQVAYLGRGQIEYPQSQAQDGQGGGNQEGRAKHRFGLFFEQETEYRTWNRRGYEKEQQAAPAPVAIDGAVDYQEPVLPVVDEQGQQRPHVQGDVKGQAGIVPSEKPRCQRQMCGTGNR